MAKKEKNKYFRQYVQDAIMIQAENNNISLTEFSNVSGTFYGRLKHTTNGFLFLLLSYSRTLGMDTSILRTVSDVTTKFSYIFFKKEPL